MKGAAFWLGSCLVAAAASAHDEPYSFVDLHLDSTSGMRGRVSVHVEDMALEIRLATPDSLLNAAFAERRSAELHAALERRLDLRADGHRVEPQWTAMQIAPERKLLRFDWKASGSKPAHVELEGPLLPYDPAHETYFTLYVEGELRHQDLLDAHHTSSPFETGIHQNRWSVVRRFLFEGVHHIFIGPDHVLFVVGLLLLGGSLRQLLEIVTAFTFAHSVTLVLATLGIVTPPARLVEPAIALSIVYIGADNLLHGKRQHDRRAFVAAGFGLVHGFGFASVLRDLGLPRGALAGSLFSFNIGVEIGQACIVVVLAPLLALLRTHKPRISRSVVAGGSALVVAAGTYWFVQRVFLS